MDGRLLRGDESRSDLTKDALAVHRRPVHLPEPHHQARLVAVSIEGLLRERQHVADSRDLAERLAGAGEELAGRLLRPGGGQVHVEGQMARRAGRCRRREIEFARQLDARRRRLPQFRQSVPHGGTHGPRIRPCRRVDRQHRGRLAVEAREADRIFTQSR